MASEPRPGFLMGCDISGHNRPDEPPPVLNRDNGRGGGRLQGTQQGLSRSTLLLQGT